MRTVLISGAGIAGAALALLLRRAGYQPTVAERASAVRDGGQAVDIRGAAIEVMRRMGLLEAARAQATGVQGLSYVDAKGRVMANLDAAFGVFDPQDVEIQRGDLVHLLHDAAGDEVEWLFGEAIIGLESRADSVDVRFAGGGSRRFDLVIGADGTHSAVRALVFGPDERFLHPLGLGMTIFSVANDFGLDHWQRVHVLPGRVVSLTNGRRPEQASAVFFFGDPPEGINHRDLARQRGALEAAFAGVDWEVPRLLRAAACSPDFYFDTTSQVRMDAWTSGRVALVGDAGYGASALSGQGTSLALVGAYVLAAELAAARGDPAVAFPRYNAAMRPFVLANQKLALGNVKRFAPASRWEVTLQTQMIRWLPHMPWRRFVMEMIAREVLTAANAVTLPPDWA
jgi:2-polyprenyl-6-methoxyphenol hydroxylase-like FAD-dependent oxidoreductase